MPSFQIKDGAHPLVILDCDGVLVENTAFERRVTKTLVEELARTRRVSTTAASALWSEELASTRRDWRWYDYAFHCGRLGLKAGEIVHAAHAQAAHLLSEVEGVFDTLEMLSKSGYLVGVATDATQWVAQFKLKHLGVHIGGPVFTSDSLQATKATRNYWDSISMLHPEYTPIAFVDNRAENLRCANSVLGLRTVQFLRHEHVTTLSPKVAPISQGADRTFDRTATDHVQLRKALQDILPSFRQIA